MFLRLHHVWHIWYEDAVTSDVIQFAKEQITSSLSGCFLLYSAKYFN